MQISRNSFTLLVGAAASALILSACGGGSSSTPSPTAQAALTVSALATSLDPSGTTTLSSSGGTGTGATTYTATGACTVSSTTLTAASTSGACTVTATKAADSTYSAITSAALTVTVRAAQAALTVAAVKETLTPSGAASASAFVSGYTDTDANVPEYSRAGRSVEGGSFNWYQSSVNGENDWSNFWWSGITPITKTTTLSSSGGNGTGAVTYSVASGSCTITGTTLTAATSIGACTVTATKAADASYRAATSAPLTIKVDTSNFYYGIGLASSTTVPYIGAYINAAADGSITLSGKTKLRIAVWGNPELTGLRAPTFSVGVQLAKPNEGCLAFAPIITPAADGAQSYDLLLSGFTLDNGCAAAGVTTVSGFFQLPISSVHARVYKANMYFNGTGVSPNGINMGTVSFEPQ